MASPRMLAKIISTAANISAGMLLALRDRSQQIDPPPTMLRELVRLIAESVALQSHPDDETLSSIQAHLSVLTERYGTMRGAIEAMAAGARRHPAISHEKAHAWNLVMLSSVAQIETTLKRAPGLAIVLGRWISGHGETLDARLDELQRWLDLPLVDAPWRAMFAVVPVSQTAEEETPASLENVDLERAQHDLLDEKPIVEQGHRVLSAAQRAAANALSADDRPLARAVGAIALGKFAAAEAHIAELRTKIHGADFWTLWGDRYYFEGRFDDAVEPYRSARAARDDGRTRLNLAVALMRSRRGQVEQLAKEAIDLLTDALRTGSGTGATGAARLEGWLGVAWMLYPQGDRDANIRRAIEHIEASLALTDRAADTSWWAQTHLELGSAWIALPTGKKNENIQRAITCFERAGQVWTRPADPERWAAVQNALGHAWERLPLGDRAANVEKSLAFFRAALEVRTRDANPIGWATLQNNLGNVWVQSPSGDHRSNIAHAIECHQAALEVWSAYDRRLEWAATQNNLGNAWAMLPASADERGKNLRRAIAAYKAALEVRTRAAYPVDWASTQNNMGSALLHLAALVDDQGATGREAVACFERSLEVRTRDAFPIDWAKTESNLGNAWAKMPGKGHARLEQLKKAVEHYARALAVFTPGAHPHQHEHITQRKAEAMDLIDEIRLMS